MLQKILTSRRGIYPYSFRLRCVRDYHLRGIPAGEIIERHKLAASTFWSWNEKYKERILLEERIKILSLSSKDTGSSPMKSDEISEIKRLRKELERRDALVKVYETMMELAKEYYDIDVKKNYEEYLCGRRSIRFPKKGGAL